MAQYFQISLDQLKQLFPDLATVGEDSVQYALINQNQEQQLNNIQISNPQVQDEGRQGAVANNCISVVKAENLNGQYCLSVKDANPSPNNVYVLEGVGPASNSSAVIQANEVSQSNRQQVTSTTSFSSKPVQTIYITTAPSEPVVPSVTYVSVSADEISELSETSGIPGNSPQKTGLVLREAVVNSSSPTKNLNVNKENHASLEPKEQVELEEVAQESVLSSSQVQMIQRSVPNSVNRLASQVEAKLPSTQLIALSVPQQSVSVSPSSVVQQVQSNCRLSSTQVSLPGGQSVSLQEFCQMQPQSQTPVRQTVKGVGRGESPLHVNRPSPKPVKRAPRRGAATPRPMKRGSPVNSVPAGRVIVLDQRRDLLEQNLLLVRDSPLPGEILQEPEPPQLIRPGSNSDVCINHFGAAEEPRQVVMLVPGGIGDRQMLTVTVPTNDVKSGGTPISSQDIASRQSSRPAPKPRVVSTSPGNVITQPRAVNCEGTFEQTSSSSGSFVTTPILTKQHMEERKLVPGKVAHCQYCGYHSEDFNRCDRCRRKVPVNCKEMPISHSKVKDGISCQKFYKQIREGGMSDNNMPKPDRNIRPKRPRKFEEPVILTISSDEDEETEPRNDDSLKDGVANNFDFENGGLLPCGMELVLPPLSSLSAFEKEPVIKENPSSEPAPEEDRNIAQAIEEGLQESQNGMPSDDCRDKIRPVFLTCRTVRIGSYKAIPKDRVVICKQGIRIRVPDIEDCSKSVTVTFPLRDVVKALIHFGRAMPVIFLYTSFQCGVKLRNCLGMTSKNGLYYDPCAVDETQKRITLLPERMTEDTKSRLKLIFCGKDRLGELDSKEANDILVRASPKEVQETIKKSLISSPTTPVAKPVKDFNQKILIYPPPPAKGGITINPEDYLCLGEEQFLNDVIIDFYLKYLTQSCLSEVDQSRTHVFSSFFYKRLTTRPVRSARRHHPVEMDGSTSPAEKRHARVKGWTKNVDIFEKDFIVIPINESAHWFLAIICFPGLEGCVRMRDGVPVKLPPSQPKPSRKSKELKKQEMEKEEMIPAACLVKPIQIGNTTITPITTPVAGAQPGSSNLGLPVATINLDERDGGMIGDDYSDRDEAEGEEEDIQMPSESEDEGAVEGGAEEGGEGKKEGGEGDCEKGQSGGEEEEETKKAEGGSGDGAESMSKEEEGEKEEAKEKDETEEKDAPEEKDQKSSKADDTKQEKDPKPEDANAVKSEEGDNTEYCSPNDPIKQPCILIFDSLAGTSRSRVVATLRDYLRIEYKVKKGAERDFSKDTIKGACPRVPQQTNFVDCGLYVLQYVESFFENPIKDYRIPIRSLTQWFPEEVVNRKREAIHELIIKLMKDQNITVKLPKIILPSPLSRTVNFPPEEEEVVVSQGDIGEMIKMAQEQGPLIVKTDQSGNRAVTGGMRLIAINKMGDKVKVVLETMGNGEPMRVERVYSVNVEDRGVSKAVVKPVAEPTVALKEEGEVEEPVPSKEAEGLEEGELEDEEMEVDKKEEEKVEQEEEILRKQVNPVVRSYQANKRKSVHKELPDCSQEMEICESESAGKKLKS
ncbi:uncharacterized protein LOC124160329 isoform X2 [Ischnura elegans]|uniref:uncharacterized protein LOC124160329 isoform X2 n=1 Tax=Ischnura elegans TaxID=197161 RepID=UPI001ED8ABAB|nr:uncharacterized protein LOC124160329 isoform X2 [Ischnura elegans]